MDFIEAAVYGNVSREGLHCVNRSIREMEEAAGTKVEPERERERGRGGESHKERERERERPESERPVYALAQLQRRRSFGDTETRLLLARLTRTWRS